MELKYLVDPETFDKTLDEEAKAIASLIDTLKDMALVDRRAGIPSIIEFDHQLQELYPKRKELDEQLRKLKAKLSNLDNFIDRELELNDEQELLRTKKDINELLMQKEQYEAERTPYINRRLLIINGINDAEKEVSRLKELNIEDFDDAINVYISGIESDKIELAKLEDTINKYENLIAEINRKLLPLNKKKEELEHKLETPYVYIDTVKKTEVEKEFDSVTRELTDVDVAIGNISNHPVYLAATARIPLKSGGTEILKNIIKQLSGLAKKVPHMDTPEADIANLDEEKAHLIKERDKAYREKQNSNGLVKPLENRLDSFAYGEEGLVSDIDTWLAKAKEKQNSLVAEAKKVLEDKNRLAEELDYRKSLKPEDTKPEVLKETQVLADVKATYDEVYDSYIKEITLYQSIIESLDNMVRGNITILEDSYNTSLKDTLESTLESLKEHKIGFLGTKSRIDQEVEELMMEVVGIDHRKKFSNSPSEIETELNEKIDAMQAKFDEQMHTFFAPEPEVEEPKEDLAEPLPSVEEVPVIDLNDNTYVAAPVADDFGEEVRQPSLDEEPMKPVIEEPVVESKEQYVHEPVGEYFGEPEPEDDPTIVTTEIPVFNPVDDIKPEKPDLESGELLKVTDVQELGLTTDESKDRQADFTAIIPQDKTDTEEEVDFSEIDRILNSNTGRGR